MIFRAALVRPLAALAAFAAPAAAVACLDIASPVTGIASITPIIAPTPSVVVNDSTRDTNGIPQPLRVIAFAPNGDTVRDARVVFFAIDSTRKLRVDSLTGIAHGDGLSPNAQVVARVSPANGSGSIQTFALALPVVPIPRRLSKETDVTLFEFTASTDTLSSNLRSPALTVKVRGASDTIVTHYLVSYEIVTPPPSTTSEPSVVLVKDDGRVSTLDTTDVNGSATRYLRVRPSAIEGEVLVGTKTVTAVVRVHAKYLGAPLTDSPVEFTVPIRGRLP